MAKHLVTDEEPVLQRDGLYAVKTIDLETGAVHMFAYPKGQVPQPGEFLISDGRTPEQAAKTKGKKKMSFTFTVEVSLQHTEGPLSDKIGIKGVVRDWLEGAGRPEVDIHWNTGETGLYEVTRWNVS